VTKRILLGDIVAAHGIRGEVVLRTHTADPEAIGAYGALVDEAGGRTFVLTSAKATTKGVIGRIKGVTTRNEAEVLRGTKLYVARDALPPPEDGDYYHEDLIGLAAVTPDGSAIGKVVAMQNFGAGDLIEIQLAGGKLTEFVPFTDACVPTVDIAGGKVVVVRPTMVGDAEPGASDATGGTREGAGEDEAK
jgi:16S rRNA processing protein RimM